MLQGVLGIDSRPIVFPELRRIFYLAFIIIIPS